eukprot:13396313-Ditylum_brightwellii.AAC.1
MGQNLFFPAFNADQMGDIFYLTPITVLVFGVNDNSRPDGHNRMNVYVWHEKDAIADNCGGQNKNQDVIRFHAWLAEAEYFKRVNIVFLVKGHTKNA